MKIKTTKVETRLNDHFLKIAQEAEEMVWIERRGKDYWLSRAKFRRWFLANCIKFAALNIIVNGDIDEVLSQGELDAEYKVKSSKKPSPKQLKWSLPKRFNLN